MSRAEARRRGKERRRTETETRRRRRTEPGGRETENDTGGAEGRRRRTEPRRQAGTETDGRIRAVITNVLKGDDNMIDCKFDFVEFRLSVTGHAGAEKNLQDHDLVCCAASTITQQLLHSLELLQEEKGALYDLESNLDGALGYWAGYGVDKEVKFTVTDPDE